MLASHCDYRVAADGSFKIGFNEVQVGLPLPPTIMHTFSDLVGTRNARRLGTEGRLIDMVEAHDIGLVDELVPVEQVVTRAVEYADSLLQLPPIAMNRTRMVGKAALLEALQDDSDVGSTTEDWFSAETQAAMTALVESLKKP